MKVVGRVESLWRYPVKSMRGEHISEAFLGFAGLHGDRRYAFHYSRAPKNFPYLTAREQPDMLLYQPKYREGPVIVETPSGEQLPIDDHLLLELLSRGIRDGESVTLLNSDRAMTDAHPISLLSRQTVRQLGDELESDLDKRRFRANIYIDLESNDGFSEDEFVGLKLLIGSQAIVEVIERDPRCKMITLDPDTAVANPNVIRQVARAHDGKVGIYGAVSVEGIIGTGDEISLAP